MKRTKRIAICAFAGTVLYLAINGWDHRPNQSLIWVILFVQLAIYSGYLYESRRLPRPMLSVMDGLRRFIGGHLVLVLGAGISVALSSLAPSVETLPEHAQAIYQATNTVGTVWLVAVTLWQGISVLVGHRQGLDFLVSSMERFVLLLVALIAVRLFGMEIAELFETAKADPDGAMQIGFAVLLVHVVAALAPKRFAVVISAGSMAAGGCAVSTSERRPREARDIHRTAVHEAGHLLLFAGLAKLPSDLTVSVAAELGDGDMVRGMVRHSGDAREGLLESEIHRLMLMLLAGAEAEFLLLDNRGDGARDDNAKWLNAANHYLLAGFGEVFYARPKDELQLEHNRMVLNDLKARCVGEVGVFLTKNQELLSELAAKIADEKHLNLEQIAPYLQRAVGTESLPLCASL